MARRKLEGRSALITGAGRGVGAALAKKIAKDGAKVIVADLDRHPAENTVNSIREAGGEAAVFCGNVMDSDFGERAIDFMIRTFGGVDIIVNNAGYIWNSSIGKTSDEQWQAMIDCHATAPFRILRAAAAFIRRSAAKEKQEGAVFNRKVVNVSSIAGFYGGATQIGYSAAKAAQIGITKTLAKEWAKYRVNVNCVGFGFIETRLTQAWSGDEPARIEVGNKTHAVGFHESASDELVKAIPMRRAGTAEEAAGALYLFCLPESDYITGEWIVAGGGLLSY